MGRRAAREGAIDLFELHRRDPARYPFLLQSVAAHALSGRYDLLFAFPGAAITGDAFFDRLGAAYAQERVTDESDSGLLFCGGWFLLIGYEAAAQIEPRLKLPASPYRLPDALAVRCPAVLIHDRQIGSTTVYAEQDQRQIDVMLADLDACVAAEEASVDIAAAQEDDAGLYLAGVQRILDYLQAGDIFQANLSRAWRAALRSGSAADVYARLRRANPAPFAGMAQWQGSSVLSSSPERLLRVDGGIAQTRPIAGTRARGRDAADDAQQRQRLIENVKERAEHVMLIDLERNDLGRVCQPASVEVSELMSVETYAHVHHIVSNVRGRLRDDASPVDALRAVFPGGTITGCPKVRAMEILAELEGVGRGPYTGAMGYLSRCGRLDTNILIRSLVIEDGEISFRAGAGIVADSNPEAELAETRTKARGLLLALGASGC